MPEKQRCAQRQQRIGGVKTEAGLKGCWPMWEQSDIRKEDSDGLNKQHWGGGEGTNKGKVTGWGVCVREKLLFKKDSS